MAEKDLGTIAGDKQHSVGWQRALSSEGSQGPGLHQQEHSQQIEEWDYSTLCGIHSASPGVLCPPHFSRDSKKQERTLQRGHQDEKGLERLLYEERSKVLGLFSLEKRSLGGI